MNGLGDYAPAATGSDSPDGLGQYLAATEQPQAPPSEQGPVAPERFQPEQVPEPMPAALQLPVQASTAEPASARWSAGSGLLAVVLGAGIGALVGGGWGAAAGALGVGALRNSVRAGRRWGDADPTVRVEARKSAAMAVVGLGAAGYFSYRAYQARSDDR